MIFLLPNRQEVKTMHALKDRGFAISTIRFPSGMSCNVAIDVDRQQAIMIDFWRRATARRRKASNA
jgi:hypothetical protein